MEELIMENNICAKPMYKCAVCGEMYDSIEQRMHCEQECLKAQEKEAKKAAEAKKQAEYEARVNEVEKAFGYAYDLRNKLYADYGVLCNYYKFDKDDLPYTLLSWVL